MKLVIAIVFCFFNVAVVPKRKVKYAFLINSLVLAWVAYNLSTQNQVDLVFHLGLYEELSKQSIGRVISHFYFKTSPLYVLYVYALRIFDNSHMLPAVNTFLGYISFSGILYSYIKKYNLDKSKYVPVYTFLVCTLPWNDFAAGMRGALAFTVCMFAIFMAYEKEKQVFGTILCILAIFIHQSAIIFLILKIIVDTTKKMTYKGFVIVCGIILIVGIFRNQLFNVASLLANVTGLQILNTVAHSFESYVLKGNDLYEYGVVLVRGTCMLIVTYIASHSYTIDNNKTSVFDSKIKKLFVLLVCTAFGFVWQYDVFCRYAMASTLLIPMVICNSGEAELKFTAGNYVDKYYGTVLIGAALFVLIYYYQSFYSKWFYFMG